MTGASESVRTPRGPASRRRIVDHDDARRAQWLVGGASLATAAVPEAAVLLVRRLSDPLPHRLALDADTPIAAPAWERALRSALAECYRTAARPARAPVAGEVNAVCFEDRAELMACLLRDALTGTLSGRWWWRAFLHSTGGDADALLRTLWTEEAPLVPAILAHLARTGDAARLVELLTPAEASRALIAIAEAFELPGLVAPVVEPSGPMSPASHDLARMAAGERAPASHWATDALAPPWAAIAPEVPAAPAFTPERAALLGVALVLARAPHVARGRAFARALHTWRVSVQRAARGADAPCAADGERGEGAVQAREVTLHGLQARAALEPPAPAVAGPAPEQQSLERAGDRPVAVDQATSGEQALESRELVAQDVASETGRKSATSHTSVHVEDASVANDARLDAAAAGAADEQALLGSESPARQAEHPSLPGTARPRAGAPSAVDAVTLTELPERQPAAMPDVAYEQLAEGVRTELAGVFYLVNVLRHLRFFDRLDDWFGVEAAFGGWGWVELFARALLGADAQWADADPLWRTLAVLDGREVDAPLAPTLVHAAEVLGLPREWLEGAPPGELPLPPTACRPLGLALEPAMQRFMDTVVPYLRWRLAGALGRRELDDAAIDQLLRRGGLVQVTRTHVDVWMSLAAIDLATRRAGLDADPGWVPALARIVTFHFDAGLS